MPGTTEVSYIAGSGRRHHGPSMQNRIGDHGLSCMSRLDHPGVGFFKDAQDPNNADSIPNTSWWDSDWTCQQWMAWHHANVVTYGQETANQKFIEYASQVSSWSSDHFCPYESSFADYFRSQGIDFDNWVASVFATTGTVVDNAGNVVTSTSDALANVAGVLKWLLPVGVVLVSIGGILYLRNQYLAKPAVTGKRRRHNG